MLTIILYFMLICRLKKIFTGSYARSQRRIRF